MCVYGRVDGCGPAHNITAWYLEVQKAEQNIVVENCGDNHLSWTPPDPSVVAQACPFNLYRVSTDIAPQFESTMYNLQKRALYPMSRPGCWGCVRPVVFVFTPHTNLAVTHM